MTRKLGMLAVAILISGCMAMAADSWTGTVSDSHCGLKHATASAAAAKCVSGCVKNGAKYVLVSDGKVYNVDEQSKFAKYAGESVTVKGTMKGESIDVESVEAASSKDSGGK